MLLAMVQHRGMARRVSSERHAATAWRTGLRNEGVVNKRLPS